MIEKIDMHHYENELYGQGYHYIAGVDEVGRGPLAGPVVAACVVLPKEFDDERINDSKKLTEKKRDALDLVIREHALAYGIGVIDHTRIDEINILNATKEAMAIAIEETRKVLGSAAEAEANEHNKKDVEFVLIDALTLDSVPLPQMGIIKGDAHSISIAAASIIAKVYRDNLMKELDSVYPGYGFAKHKGYGTKLHYEGLRELGMCEIHRRSFVHL
jgi:ribonuclease HII